MYADGLNMITCRTLSHSVCIYVVKPTPSTAAAGNPMAVTSVIYLPLVMNLQGAEIAARIVQFLLLRGERQRHTGMMHRRQLVSLLHYDAKLLEHERTGR